MKKAIKILFVFLFIVNIKTVSAESNLEIADFSLKFSPYHNVINANRRLMVGKEKVKKSVNNQDSEADYLAKDIQGILMINGSFMPNVKIVIDNEIVFVPIRVISEHFDYELEWDAENETVKVSKENTVITLKVNEKHAIKNSVKIELAESIRNIDKQIFVPFSFIPEGFGLQSHYERNIIYDLPIVSITEKHETAISLKEALDFSSEMSKKIIKMAHKIEEEDKISAELESAGAVYEAEYFSRFYKIKLKIPKGILADSKKYFISYYIDKHTGMVYESFGDARGIYIVERDFMAKLLEK